MLVNNKLKFYRKKAGLNQTEVAIEMGITQTQYSMHENGKSVLNTNQILQLCQLYNVSPNELLGWNDMMAKKNNFIRVKEFREKADLTQRELAKLMNLSQGQIWRIEVGESLPNSEQIIQFCKIFKCTPNDLYGIKDIYDKLFDDLDSI